MPKQVYTIRDWSGGVNSRKDPRDIPDREYSMIENMSIDALGKIKTSGGLHNHIEGSDGSTNLTEYIPNVNCTVVGGYGLFYFESDHSRDADQTITETKSSTALAIGTSVGNIEFVRVTSNPDGLVTTADTGGSPL